MNVYYTILKNETVFPEKYYDIIDAEKYLEKIDAKFFCKTTMQGQKLLLYRKMKDVYAILERYEWG